MKLLKKFKEAYERLLKTAWSKENLWQDRDDAAEALASLAKATRAYKINCTGDVCKGDQILFPCAVWEKVSIRRKKVNVIDHFALLEAEVVKESYGWQKQQHTFTLLLPDGTKKLIKGRNLYRYGVWRKAWKDEQKRKAVLEEKHARGRMARRARAARIRD